MHSFSRLFLSLLGLVAATSVSSVSAVNTLEGEQISAGFHAIVYGTDVDLGDEFTGIVPAGGTPAISLDNNIIQLYVYPTYFVIDFLVSPILFGGGFPITFNGEVIHLADSTSKIEDFTGVTLRSHTGGGPNPAVSFDSDNIYVDLQYLSFPTGVQFIYDFTLAPIACANGDPQFTGFLGQSYQVHGTSDSVYNILSSSTFQYNALFRYLESGSCRSGTPCFSHPGNYFGVVGILIKNEIDVDGSNAISQIIIESGSVQDGLTVSLNNSTLPVSTNIINLGSYNLSVPTPFEVLIESNEFNLRIQNSDQFLNQDVAIGSELLRKILRYKQSQKQQVASDDLTLTEMKNKLPHGVLGQTWSLETYSNRWKHIEGQLFDYIVQDGVSGTLFKYNRF